MGGKIFSKVSTAPVTYLYTKFGRAGVALFNQVLCTGYEVGEGVLLVEIFAIFVPFPPHLASPSDVSNGIDKASV